jgi:hypothetical protein
LMYILDLINTYFSNFLSVIKLLQNYHSHPAILKFPNNQFCCGKLQAKASPAKVNKYLGSSILLSPTFPIVFHLVFRKDGQEASSPSFFNVDEILQIKQYVERLQANREYCTSKHQTCKYEWVSLLTVFQHSLGLGCEQIYSKSNDWLGKQSQYPKRYGWYDNAIAKLWL